MTIINGDANRAYRCAQFISDKYRHEDYHVQTLVDPTTKAVAVQISNTAPGFWGGLKKLVGLKACATLRIVPDGDRLKVEVGEGEWLAKGGDILIGTFVAVGVVAVTGTVGAVKQHNLLRRVENDAMAFFASDPVIKLMSAKLSA